MAKSLIKPLKKLNVEQKDINILLLGESGVGKSTFINAFANYMKYEKFQVAEKNEVLCLIPTRFEVTDENFDVKIVQIGQSGNESDKVGESATQSTRSYVFSIGEHGTRIRLIDTPGVGDTRGLSQDNLNFGNILKYISKLEHLHGVCFLLKPNNARLTVVFQYCIKQVLSVLEKSVSKNILFLFTNTRNTFYRPGDTVPALKKVLKEIEDMSKVAIGFEKQNVFCLDNESFRFMVSCKHDIKFSKEDRESFSRSWDHSVKECWRLIRFVTGEGEDTKLVPHLVSKTIETNEARRVIVELSKPLADIADLIRDNVIVLERHKNFLQKNEVTLKDLKDRLYVPTIDLKTISLKHPVTVCTNAKCSEIYTVQGCRKSHYKQVCHEPCYLDNIPRDIIGSPELINCYAIDHPSKLCSECKCDFSSHMHVYYLTEMYTRKIRNHTIDSEINNCTAESEKVKLLVEGVESIKQAYENERSVIIKCMAKFAHFLQDNAVVACNDTYQGYIAYLIDREKSRGSETDKQIILYYQNLLNQYNAEKMILEEALKEHSTVLTNVSSSDIFKSVESLFSLKHTGNRIRHLHLEESKLRNIEFQGHMEYVLPRLPAFKNNDTSLVSTFPHQQTTEQILQNIELERTQQNIQPTFGQLLKRYFQTKSKK